MLDLNELGALNEVHLLLVEKTGVHVGIDVIVFGTFNFWSSNPQTWIDFPLTLSCFNDSIDFNP